jgi:hypothetical protein
MQTILCALSALTVAWIYYFWRSYHTELLQRERTLRERVAYMLWVTARMAS